MIHSKSVKPAVRAGWLRVLLYIPSMIIVILTGLSVFVLAVHKDHLAFPDLLEWFNGNKIWLFTIFLFTSSLLVTYVFRRWIDRKSFISLGFSIRGHFGDAIAGTMLSVFIICATSLLLKFTGHLKWMDIIFDPRAIFIAFGIIALSSFAEELIFRGYILGNLMESFAKWPALLISALLFMIMHWTTNGFFPLVNTLVLGMILGLNYIYTRNLWFSICFHTGWKFLEGPLLGFPGNESFQTLLQADIHGDENITGGANGLEGSFILLAISLLSLVTLFLFIQKKLSPQSPPVPGRI